jgi:hypothetical protein
VRKKRGGRIKRGEWEINKYCEWKINPRSKYEPGCEGDELAIVLEMWDVYVDASSPFRKYPRT